MQQSTTLQNHVKPIVLCAGETVCKARWFAPIGKSKQWYCEEENSTYVRMSTVLIPNMMVLKESSENKMPKSVKRTLNKCKLPFEVNPVKIEDSYFVFIDEEIKRREQVEHIMTNDEEGEELIFDNSNYDSEIDMDDLNVFDNNEEEEREM